MKNILFILFVVAIAFGCNRSQNSATSTESNKESVEKNAKNEFNYHGKYIGILPCADCEGIETEIELRKDNTFTKKTKYLGKPNATTTEVTGKYSWSHSGNTIVLDNITDAPNKYAVTEGAITQLDMDGSPITGELWLQYRLSKTF